jgi:hypothetical protein
VRSWDEVSQQRNLLRNLEMSHVADLYIWGAKRWEDRWTKMANSAGKLQELEFAGTMMTEHIWSAVSKLHSLRVVRMEPSLCDFVKKKKMRANKSCQVGKFFSTVPLRRNSVVIEEGTLPKSVFHQRTSLASQLYDIQRLCLELKEKASGHKSKAEIKSHPD